MASPGIVRCPLCATSRRRVRRTTVKVYKIEAHRRQPIAVPGALQASSDLRGTLRLRKSYSSGRDLGSETMIRPILVAMALACTSTSASSEACIASHYGYSGGKTASCERMNPSAMTAAHRTRSFGSHVTVTSHASGRSVTVRINDRGPFVKGRCIDLSTEAAGALGMAGLQKVSLR